jgi:cell division protein FtsA
MEVICALDIGTSKIRSIVAYNEDGIPKIKAILNFASSGLKRGSIVDLSLATKSLYKIFEDVRQIERKALKNIYVNIGTVESSTHVSTAPTGISSRDGEISYQDIEKVKRESENINLGQNRRKIHTVYQEFIVDGVSGIIDEPIGFSGTRLEVKSLIVEGFAPYIKNVEKAVSLSGGKVLGMVFNPISSSRAVVSKIQKELGVVVVDLGFNTTGVAVYADGKLLNVKIFPVGSANITSDIALGLKIPYDLAEKIKIDYGCAFSKGISSRENIDLSNLTGEEKNLVSKKFLSEIIEARLSEIFELINKEIKQCGKIELAGGVLFVGGGSKLKGLTEFARNELKLSSQLGVPLFDEFKFENEYENIISDPEYTNVLGIMLLGAHYENWHPKNKSFFDKIKNIFSSFEP